mgnify:FL=1
MESTAVHHGKVHVKLAMDKRLNNMKEWLHYIDIVCIALFSGLFLVIKLAVTDAREETKNIGRVSKM